MRICPSCTRCVCVALWCLIAALTKWLCAARRLRDLPVDLYQLFLHVKARGGNDQVSVLVLGLLGCVPGPPLR